MKTIKILFFTLLTIINTSIFAMELDTPNKNTLIEKMANLDSMSDEMLDEIFAQVISSCDNPEEVFFEMVKIARISKKFKNFMTEKQIALNSSTKALINNLNKFDSKLKNLCEKIGYFILANPQKLKLFNLPRLRQAKLLMLQYAQILQDRKIVSANRGDEAILSLSELLLKTSANTDASAICKVISKVPKLNILKGLSDSLKRKTIQEVKNAYVQALVRGNFSTAQNILKLFPNTISSIAIDCVSTDFINNVNTFIFSIEETLYSRNYLPLNNQQAEVFLKNLFYTDLKLNFSDAALIHIAKTDKFLFQKILVHKYFDFKKHKILYANSSVSDCMAQMLPNNDAEINQQDAEGQTELIKRMKQICRTNLKKDSKDYQKHLYYLKIILEFPEINPFICCKQAQKNGSCLLKNAFQLGSDYSQNAAAEMVYQCMVRKLEQLRMNANNNNHPAPIVIDEAPSKKQKMEK